MSYCFQVLSEWHQILFAGKLGAERRQLGDHEEDVVKNVHLHASSYLRLMPALHGEARVMIAELRPQDVLNNPRQQSPFSSLQIDPSDFGPFRPISKQRAASWELDVDRR
jgi:hypothetical protein